MPGPWRRSVNPPCYPAQVGHTWRCRLMTAVVARPGAGTMNAKKLAYLDEHLQRYISSGKLTGALTVVHHRGQVAHRSALGLMDRERGKPVAEDTIFRAY